MLEELRKKRLAMTQQFPTRPRISSLEKRKAIEASLQDFRKDLNQSNPSVKSSNKKQAESRNRPQLRETPTLKDLSVHSDILPPLANSQEEQEVINSPRFKSDRKETFPNPFKNYNEELQTIQNYQKKQEENLIVDNQSFGASNCEQPQTPRQPKQKDEESGQITEKQQKTNFIDINYNQIQQQVQKIAEQKVLQKNEINARSKEILQNVYDQNQSMEMPYFAEKNIDQNQDNFKEPQEILEIRHAIPNEVTFKKLQEEPKQEQKSEEREQSIKITRQVPQKQENSQQKLSIDQRKENLSQSYEERVKLDRSQDSFSQKKQQKDLSNAEFNYSITEVSADGIPKQEEEADSLNKSTQSEYQYKNRTYSPTNNKKVDKIVSFPSHQVKITNKTVYSGSQSSVKPELQKIKEVQEFQPTYEKVEGDDGLNFNYNESHYGSQSNNSSAIFFTSQFKEYLNRQKNLDAPEKSAESYAIDSMPITQGADRKEATTEQNIQKQKEAAIAKQRSQLNDSILKMGQEYSEENFRSDVRKLITDPSGRSLAESQHDESSLKYSRANDSAVYELVNKKLDEELVLEICHFSQKKLFVFIEAYIDFECLNTVNLFKNLTRILKIQKKMKNNLLRECFDGLIINKDCQQFNETKNKLKADEFRKQAQEHLIRNIFIWLKEKQQEKQTKAMVFKLKKQNKLRTQIFKIFRMVWYDARVRKQADLYYLSKVFSALREAGLKEKKKGQHAALRLYCKNLKRFSFNKLCEGVENSRRERQTLEIAKDHYRYTLLRKHLNAWVSVRNREPQYISLAMTSKNAFKETVDHRWLQTKTVDFKQLK